MLAGMAPRRRRRSRGRDEARWLLAGYAGLTGFFALEGLLRQPGSASSLHASDDDRGTTRIIAIAYGLAIDIPLLARWLPRHPLPPAVAPAGLLVQVTGLTVRAWSMRALGRSYSRTLRTEDDEHVVIDGGPYHLIRHPGYLGSLLTWIGFALTSRSAPVVALVPGLLGAAYSRRIMAEETLLRRDLPGYTSYSERTTKLIPFVW
jgi:protein-S-isoprenylcysteine O-methyltransferase Ste14